MERPLPRVAAFVGRSGSALEPIRSCPVRARSGTTQQHSAGNQRAGRDDIDGFVRPSVDLPLATMDLDAGSLGVFIRTLVLEVESTLSAVRHTLATGEIVVSGTSATPPTSPVSGP